MRRRNCARTIVPDEFFFASRRKLIQIFHPGKKTAAAQNFLSKRRQIERHESTFDDTDTDADADADVDVDADISELSKVFFVAAKDSLIRFFLSDRISFKVRPIKRLSQKV